MSIESSASPARTEATLAWPWLEPAGLLACAGLGLSGILYSQLALPYVVVALLLWATILIYLWRQPRVAALAWVQGVSSSGPLGTWQLRWRANSGGMQDLIGASDAKDAAWMQVRLESYSYWRLGISLGFRCIGTSAEGRKVQLLIPRGRISETQFRQLSAQLRHSP